VSDPAQIGYRLAGHPRTGQINIVSLNSVLKKIYFRIPVLRQLCQIREHLGELRREMATLRTLQFIGAEDALHAHPRYGDPLRLHKSGFRVFSQNLEDGMIAEIFRRIGASAQTFVEIGVGDGHENNTRYLLLAGWRGWWFEGDANHAASIQNRFSAEIESARLKLQVGMLEVGRVGAALKAAAVPDELDLLSLDVDRLTYHVLLELSFLRPRVLVVEYNASFPPPVDWVAPAAPAHWDGSVCFGASLAAFERLLRERGYVLVGCDLSGTNAFFVRADLAGDHFFKPYDAATHYESPRYGNRGHGAGPANPCLAPQLG
jgi:hypothetical protein